MLTRDLFAVAYLVFLPLLFPRPHRGGSIMHWRRCLSVRLSVPCLTVSGERNGVKSWRLAGKKHEWPVTAFRDRKLKHLPWEDDFGTARLVCFTGRQCSMDDSRIMTSKLTALDGFSSHHLQGRGHIVAALLRIA